MFVVFLFFILAFKIEKVVYVYIYFRDDLYGQVSSVFAEIKSEHQSEARIFLAGYWMFLQQKCICM